MAKAKFIISTDTSGDVYKSELERENIYCIIMKRVVDGEEVGEIYDSVEEYDNFYVELRKGKLPTTTQLNTYELEDYFKGILEKEPEGDIIHIPLSSGLSGTCDNAKAAAEKVNENLSDRKVYVVDSLLATAGINMLVDRLVEMRNSGMGTLEAIERVQYVRDHQQAWIIVSDLFHLKRGGRISGFKAALGTLLNIRPVITLSNTGRLAIENTIKGDRSAFKYVFNKVEELGVKARADFYDNTIYLVRTSPCQRYDDFKKAFTELFPKAKIKESVVCPIIGTHLGCDCAIVLFEGAKRSEIK